MKNLRNVLLTCLVIFSLAVSLAVFAGSQEVQAKEDKTPTYAREFNEFLKSFNPQTATSSDWKAYHNWINAIKIYYGGIGLDVPYYLAKDGSYYYDAESETFVPLKSDFSSLFYTWNKFYPDYYNWYWGWYYANPKVIQPNPSITVSTAKPEPAPQVPSTITSKAPENNLIQATLDQGQSNYEVRVTLSENTGNTIVGKVEVKDKDTQSYLTNVGQIKVVAYGFNGGTAYVLVNGQYQLANWQQTINNCLMFTLQAGQTFKVVK